jgi:predicted transcriptional regulator
MRRKRKMLTLEEIKKMLKPMNLKAVSEAAGVSYNTVYRLAKTDADPNYSTVKAISDYLENWK